MITKGCKLYSVLYQKCPQCHEGPMFPHSPYSSQFATMNQTCPQCGMDFIQEPSFYFGAMYFSYAIQVMVFTLVYLILRYTIDPGTWTYVVWMVTASIVILPLNYRWSRVSWINLFAAYKKSNKNV